MVGSQASVKGSKPNGSPTAVPHLAVSGGQGCGRGRSPLPAVLLKAPGRWPCLRGYWPDSRGLSRLQRSKMKGAFHGITWLYHLGQGAKFTDKEFLPLFNIATCSVHEREKERR